MFDEQDLIDAIRRVADERPDLVYRDPGWRSDYDPPACRYLPSTVNPQTGCVVGTALARLGVPDEVLRRMDGDDPVHPDDTPTGWDDSGIADLLGDVFTEDALRSKWVREVQRAQDAGKPWGKAVAVADARWARQDQ